MSVDQDMLISYALGHLTPRAEAEVVTHLEAHPEDAARVSAYIGSLADFALQLAPEPLPETGEADLLARIRGEAAPEASEPSLEIPPEMPLEPLPEPLPEPSFETPSVTPGTPAAPAQTPPPPVILVPSPPRRPVWWLAGLGAAAVAALLYFSVLLFVSPEDTYAQELEQYQAEPGAVSYTLTQEGQAAPLGTLVWLQNGRVFVTLDAPPAENQVYQAWNIGDAAVSLGTFSERSFLSQTEVPVGNTFGLTLEPPGGSDQPTTTPLTRVEL